MKRLIIIIFCLFLSLNVSAQHTNGRPVFTDGTTYWSTYSDATNELEIVLPAYACYSLGTDPLHTAWEVTVINGTIESGSITNTWIADESYLLVGESGRFDVQFAFTNITGFPAQMSFAGYYQGNPSHNISYEQWDYTAGAWDIIDADFTLFKDGTYFSVNIPMPSPQTNYVNGTGNATSRFYHSASTVAANDFAIDYHYLLEAQISIPTANVFYAASDLSVCGPIKRFNTNTMDFTNTTAGVYKLGIGGSGTGSTNTTFKAAIFTNGVITDIFFLRKINAFGDVGNASDQGMLELDANTTISYRLTADRDDAFASFFNFHGWANKIDN